jgi:hypothetical protein
MSCARGLALVCEEMGEEPEEDMAEMLIILDWIVRSRNREPLI